MAICQECNADLHMAQLMPLSLTVSSFIKIQIGFTFLVPAHPGSPGQRAVKRVWMCHLATWSPLQASWLSATWPVSQLTFRVGKCKLTCQQFDMLVRCTWSSDIISVWAVLSLVPSSQDAKCRQSAQASERYRRARLRVQTSRQIQWTFPRSTAAFRSLLGSAGRAEWPAQGEHERGNLLDPYAARRERLDASLRTLSANNYNHANQSSIRSHTIQRVTTLQALGNSMTFFGDYLWHSYERWVIIASMYFCQCYQHTVTSLQNVQKWLNKKILLKWQHKAETTY